MARQAWSSTQDGEHRVQSAPWLHIRASPVPVLAAASVPTLPCPLPDLHFAPCFPKPTPRGESRAAVIKPAPANPQIPGSGALAGPPEQDPFPSLWQLTGTAGARHPQPHTQPADILQTRSKQSLNWGQTQPGPPPT